MGYGLMEEPVLQQDALFMQRQRFWQRFAELGYPRPKQEAFQYLPLRKLSYPIEQAEERSAAEPEMLAGCCGRIVFCDGYFDSSLSTLPLGCILLPLDEAMKAYGLVLQNRMARALKEEKDPFAALNGALHGRGAFLYVPPNLVLEKPIHVSSHFTSGAWMAQRLQLFLGKSAQASLIQTFSGSGTAVELVDAVLDAGAKLQMADRSHLAKDAVFFRNVRASIKRDAKLSSFSYSEGAACLRRSFWAALLEENSEVHLKGLDNLFDEAEAHTYVHVEHAAPHCLSHQHFKKALHDKSRSSFEGKIYVHPQAQKTEAYQLNQNLILSSDAAAHAKPNLEIFADDVKASHGATFSQLSDEDLFYLRTRGIPIKDAKKLLFEGFCKELLDASPFEVPL